MAFKSFTYRVLLLVTLIFVLGSISYAQNSRERFFSKLDEAYEVLEGEPKRAIELASQAHDVAKAAKDRWAMAIGLGAMGSISYEVGDYEAAYKNQIAALRAIRRADTTDLYNETLILNHLSIIHSDFNNHDESIEYGKEALRVAKQYIKKHPDFAEVNGDARLLVDIPYYMAVEYQEKGAHQTAGNILVDLWEQAEDKEDIVSYALVLNELGIVKMNNGEFKDAQEYFGLVVSGRDVYEEDKSVAYHNLAYTYMEQGNYEKADSYFLIALDMKKGLEDDYGQFVTYQDIGELEFRRGNKGKAIEYWETALNTYDQVDGDPELYSVFNWLQLAYMDSDVEKAKEFNLIYAEKNNFYVKNQTFQREQEAQNRQQLINIIDEERQERIDAEERNRFIQQFWPVFLGVALLVIFSMVMGVRYYRALRANKELANARLNAQAVSED